MEKPPIPWWVTPGLAVVAAGIFIAALGLAYLSQDKSLFNVMCGTAGALVGIPFNWFFGSSKGSQDKDATIAASAAARAVSVSAEVTTADLNRAEIARHGG